MGLVLHAITLARGQTPDAVGVLKIDEYVQTSADQQSATGYDFVAFVSFPTAVSVSAQLQSPTGTTLSLARQPDGTYAGVQSFATRTALEGAFPDGNYTLAITSGPTPSSRTIAVTTGAFISPVKITNFDALQAWPNRDPEFNWEPIPNASSGDLISIVVSKTDGTEVTSSTSGFNPSSVRFIAFGMPLNTDLQGDLTYGRLSLVPQGAIAIAAGHGFDVQFPFRCSVPAPTIITQPRSQMLQPGIPVALSVTAAGGGTLFYQWKKDGSVIPGATSATYMTPRADDFIAGVYTVEISSLGGRATSNPAILAIGRASPDVVAVGMPATFSVAPATSGISYQWKKNGTPLAGATQAKYSIINAKPADAGRYTVDLSSPASALAVGPFPFTVTAVATVATFAGQPGVQGAIDGTRTTAQFYRPSGIATDSSGNIYVSESFERTIRKIASDGTVTTLAGTAGKAGSADGQGSAAQFLLPEGLTVDSGGNVYVVDSWGGTIRKITPSGSVSTFAGHFAGQVGSADGSGIAAQFNQPQGITSDRAGNLFVTDTGNDTIRKITPSGRVTTFAGVAGEAGRTDGPGTTARFYNPAAITSDGAGNLYVADTGNNLLRKVTPAGVVTTIAGRPWSDVNPAPIDGAAGTGFNGAFGIAVDASGTVYFADSTALRRLTQDGVITTLCLGKFGAIAIDPAANIDVVDLSNYVIARAAVTAGANDPAIMFTSQPQSWTVAAGSTTVLTASATGPGLTYQWQKDGVTIPGAYRPTLLVTAPQTSDAGVYRMVAANGAGMVASESATLSVIDTNNPGRLSNLSIRAGTGVGDRTLIVGAALAGGNGTKPLLIRGVGPALANFGVAGALPAVAITLVNGSQTLGMNAGWGGDSTLSAAFVKVGAFPFAASSLDAAMLPMLAAGSYSVQLAGQSGMSGIVLAEFYDASSTDYDPTRPRLANVSARCLSGPGEQSLIAGFTISGTTPRTVLVRAVGRSLYRFGVFNTLIDPILDVRNSSGLQVASNDNWADGGASAAFSQVGAFVLGDDADAAVVVTLTPGVYTAQIKDRYDTTGIALLEVYEVP